MYLCFSHSTLDYVPILLWRSPLRFASSVASAPAFPQLRTPHPPPESSPRPWYATHIMSPRQLSIMEKHGYPPVQTPMRERRTTYHVLNRGHIKYGYLCFCAGSFVLFLWHLVNVSHTQTLFAVHAKPWHSRSADGWREHAELDDRTWKVPLEAHIMFVLPLTYL